MTKVMVALRNFGEGYMRTYIWFDFKTAQFLSMFRNTMFWPLLITINSINSINAAQFSKDEKHQENIVFNGKKYILYNSGEVQFYFSNSSSDLLFFKNDEIVSFGWNVDHYGLQHSAYAVKDSIIYSFGGYGFWHQNNVLRYFDLEEGWIPIVLEGNSMIEPCHSSVITTTENGLNVIGGQRASSENPLLTEDALNWYHIDLDSKKVTKFELQYPISANNLLGVSNDSIFWSMDNGYTGMFVISLDHYYKLEKNEIFYQNFKGGYFEIYAGKIVGNSKVFDLKDVFKFKRIDNNCAYEIALVVGLVFLILSIISALNKKRATNSCQVEVRSFERLSVNHLKFLHVLIEEGPQTGTQVLSFLDSGFTSMSNLYKKRRDFIREINDLLNYSLIVEKSNPIDTRSKLFLINEEVSKECLLTWEKVISESLES